MIYQLGDFSGEGVSDAWWVKVEVFSDMGDQKTNVYMAITNPEACVKFNLAHTNDITQENLKEWARITMTTILQQRDVLFNEDAHFHIEAEDEDRKNCLRTSLQLIHTPMASIENGRLS